MEGLLQDIRHAFRKLIRQPGFTLAALLTLSLGIGANSVLFTLINAMMLRPTPGITSPERVVSIYKSDHSVSSTKLSASSYPDWEDYQKVDVFESVAFYTIAPVAAGDPQNPVRIGAQLTSPNYFSTLGVPLRGRMFSAAEAAGGQPVAVVSHKFWQTQMGGTADAIGRTIQINGKSATVIGIAPEGFQGAMRGFDASVWLPYQASASFSAGDGRTDSRGNNGLSIIARMKPGVRIDLAQLKMRLLATQLFKSYPDNWGNVEERGRTITVMSEKQSRVMPQVRDKIFIMVGMLSAIVALVLMICCANVAGLMIARATGLSREMGIRLSIGASRGRIARLLIVEAFVLSAGAAVISLLASIWIGEAVKQLLPRMPFPIALDFSLDHRIVLFTSAIALLSAALFGTAPAIRASRSDPSAIIKGNATQVVVGRSRFSVRSILVGGQVAASVVLLVTALLFLRSMRSAMTTDLGFSTENIALLDLENAPGSGTSDEIALQTTSAIADALAATPGVTSVSWANDPPLTLSSSRRNIAIEGYTPSRGEDMEFHFAMVGPRYLGTIGVAMVRGRDLAAQDRAGAPPVIVVNETFANRFWKGQNPVGKRVSIDGGTTFATVVGVAHDARLLDVGSDVKPYMFIPELQGGYWGATMHVRMENLTADKLAHLSEVVEKAAPGWKVRNPRMMTNQVAGSILPQRIASVALVVFGALALFLSMIGLYGVIAYAVAQRTHEFGIRFALGATTRDVLQLTLNQGLRMILIGAVIGMVIAAGAAQALRTLLLGLSPLDPVSFIAAPLLLVSIGVAATLLPARRAARIDPLKALRAE